MKHLRVLSLALVAISTLIFTSCSKYKYEAVKGDPMKTRIYTLDNGLKVYLSVNKDEPRIQTMIAVDAGSRNDPSETTGLAHYLEHILFKGTQQFGTTNYEAEKPYLEEITNLYEKYRGTKDDNERKAIYRTIDSVSQIAATFAIPNEYDKLMASIGAQGTNAFTSFDQTVYTEDIPSNQIENWAKIQSDRFQNMVIRLFHTELEAVYEEYNLSLAQDGGLQFDSLINALLPNHPYGTQTTIGTQEHLKNPSIINIQNFFKTYYVPNNMAIIMSGDFDPDKTIAIIDKYFGGMQKSDVPERKINEEKPIEKPIERTVVGLEPANILLGYRLPNNKNAEGVNTDIADVVSSLLYNGKAGLIDINLVQKQQILEAYSFYYELADYGLFGLGGTPKEGQSLQDVRSLVLAQIDSIKQGNFSEDMLKSVIDNYRVSQYYKLRHNFYRTYEMLDAFILHRPWNELVTKIDDLAKVTKQDVIDFANKYFADNYAIVYKEQGTPNRKKVDKPAITAISVNRDTTSDFMKSIAEAKPTEIEPVFVDFEKDMEVISFVNGIDILYKHNDGDPLFSLYYVYEMGSNSDPELSVALKYFDYLGTDKYTPEQLKKEFYKLGASYGVSASNNRIFVYLSGLQDNFEASLDLFEHLLNNVNPDETVYANMVADILKERADNKTIQDQNFYRLREYMRRGEKNSYTNILSADALRTLKPNSLIDKIKGLGGFKHSVLYFGPTSSRNLKNVLSTKHKIESELKDVLPEIEFAFRETGEKPTIFVAQYDAENIFMGLNAYGLVFNKEIEPMRNLYNQYFGGGMGSIVFQEMREARALAYSANFNYALMQNRPSQQYTISGFIASQTDKMKDAVIAFDDIIKNMPVSEQSFAVAKESALNEIRTGRILRDDVLWTYLWCKKFGYDYDERKDVFEKLPAYTLDDVVKFQQEQLRGKVFNYAILGNIKNLDMNYLRSVGDVHVVDSKTIFGY
ncbi:MAG: insulinase family protein [Bacteroidales bacterium]|jgi:predicted Zn-dependent peptidase|nr:insulinase family protein [Bacteroidales bacterium]